MAWTIHNDVRKLVVSIDNGDPEPIENIQSAPFYVGSSSYSGGYWILQDAFFESFNLEQSGYTQYDEASRLIYYDILSKGSGTLSLPTILAMGTQAKIWNPKNGDSAYILVTKLSSNSYQAKLYHNGSQVASTLGLGLGSYSIKHCSLGFLYDSTNDNFAMYGVLITNTWDSGRAITQLIRNFGTSNSTVKNAVYAAMEVLLRGNVVPVPPYGDDDYTNSEGGNGNHDDTSDTITQDAIPLAAATRTGMCTAYVPDWGEIRDVASALLDPNIFQILAGNVVKFSDVIIGLSVFPCSIPANTTGVVKANVLGIDIGTGVIAHIADDQYVEISCGTLKVNEYWGNCLDYNPYTKISIFLPFCGTYELDVDEVMNRTLDVSYRIDIMSGACLATIKIDGSVFYQYSGQCSAQVPLSSVSFDQFLSSMLSLGVATATSVSSIGAAGRSVKDAETAFAAGGSSGSGGSALMEAREHLSQVKTQSGESILDATVGAVMGCKGFYAHAGAMSGSPGFLGVRKPFLIIKRPEQVVPSTYGMFHGYPCNTTAVLGDLSGYTEVSDIRLNIPDATVEEILECEQLLKGGVVI